MALKRTLVQEEYLMISTGSDPATGYLSFYPKSDGNFYKRTSAGVETKLWDSGNDGTGSGLDADLLDGQHGSYYTGYVQARGMNLVSNGSGLMDSNYNFSTLTFDKVDTHGGLGSFTGRSGPYTHYSNELIPVDIQRYYQGVVWAKAGNADGSDFDPGNKVYIGIVEYDADGLSVQSGYAEKIPGAVDTELAVDLNIGDTTVTLVDGTGWSTSGSWRHFVWFPYTNSQGYTYPDYGYSRNHTRYLRTEYNGGAWTSRTGNVLTLAAPWPGPALPAGKHIRQANGTTGSRKYIFAFNYSLPNSWTKFTATMKPAPSDYLPVGTCWYNGTAYFKICLLTGYGALSVQKFSDLWFSEISANNLDAFQVPIVSSVATGTAPLTIASTTLNTNLNADLLDGYHASAFALAGSGVTSFNTRTGAVTLTKADVEAVLTGLITSHTHSYTNNTGTVTSVAMTVPTGLAIAGSPITTSGTLALSFASGYSIPTTAKQTQWDAAYTHSQSAHQTIINGTGFVKANGTTLSYDNSTYALSSHNHSGVYQPLDADLTAIAGLSGTSGFLKKTAANTWSLDTTTYLTGTKVDSFNTRTGAVTLLKADVEGVLTGLITSHTHNYLSGSGTANYISKFAAAGVLANSVIYEEDGLVGIGTNSPAHELHVNGTIGASQITVQSGNDILLLTGTYLEFGDSFNYNALFKVNANSIEISGNDMNNWTAFPISIGSVGGGFGNGRYIKIDDTLDTFTINFSKVKLPLGTANAFVKTNGSKELVYDTNSYALNNHTHSTYVLKAGDTMTGDLLIQGDLTVNGITTLNAITKVGTDLVTNLNADLLDGLHSSAFSLTNHNHEAQYEPIIGLVSPRLMGRYSAGAGAWQPITIGSGLNLSTGGVLTATGGTFDNYEAWNVGVNVAGEPALYPINSINSAGTYKTVRFVEGNNMAIQAGSQLNNVLALTFNANITNNSTTRTSDLALTNVNTYYTVSSITLPSAGTYMVMGQMAIYNSTEAGRVISAKLHISTTNYSSAQLQLASSVSASMYLHTLITVGASTTITMSAASNGTGTSVDSTLVVNGAGATTTKLSYIKLS